METWLQQVAAWLPSGGLYYLSLGLIAFLESLAIIGIFVPGSIIIVLAGFFAAQGKGDPYFLMGVAALGSFLGDALSYWLGARFGTAMLNSRLMARRADLLKRARGFFIHHGGKSVFFGRFVGLLRPFIPMIAGSAQMPVGLFGLYAFISAILWGLAYPGLGFFFGASWQRVQLWTGRFSLLILVLAGLLILNHLFWRYAFPLLKKMTLRLWQHAENQAAKLVDSALSRWFADHLPGLHAFILNRFSLRRSTGLALSSGFFISLLFAVVFFWMMRALVRQTPLARGDLMVHELVLELQHPLSDLFFLIVTQLGSLPVLTIIAGYALVWLILNNRDFSTLILLLGLPAGQLLVFTVKFFFDRERPLPYLPLEALSASFPSGHAFSAVMVYGLLAYFLLGTVRVWETRFYLIFWTSFLALVIAFSRIYLGIHWLSDVLAGLALGACWLSVLITLCEIRFRFGEFPLRKGWRPFNLTHSQRLLILLPLGIVTLAASGWIIAAQLTKVLST